MEKVLTNRYTNLRRMMILPLIIYPTMEFAEVFISHRSISLHQFLMHYALFNVVAFIFLYANSFTKGQEIYFSKSSIIFKNAKADDTIFIWNDIVTKIDEMEPIFYKAVLIPISSQVNPDIKKVILVRDSNIKSFTMLAEKYAPENNCLLISIKETERKLK